MGKVARRRAQPPRSDCRRFARAIKRVSDPTRALIWVFRIPEGDGYVVPGGLRLPALLIVAALAFDLAHYVVASIVWQRFAKKKEKGRALDDEIGEAPDRINLPAEVLFGIKIVLIAAAYAMLFVHLSTRVLG